MGFPNINKPKKSLGQNFFTNPSLGRHLVEKTLEGGIKGVVEIGGGRGFFTGLFVEKNVEVFVIEKDDVLSKNLEFLFPNITVFNDDIFSEKVSHLFKKSSEYVCFGSLPYNISKKIISYVAQKSTLQNFFFIIQKEVAEKYSDGEKSSVLFLLNSLYFDVKVLKNISPENFKPRPSVNSSFVKFSRNENLKLVDDIDSFTKYLHLAFKQPRKMLKNNLKGYGCVLEKRAQDLNLLEHINLWKSLMV